MRTRENTVGAVSHRTLHGDVKRDTSHTNCSPPRPVKTLSPVVSIAVFSHRLHREHRHTFYPNTESTENTENPWSLWENRRLVGAVSHRTHHGDVTWDTSPTINDQRAVSPNIRHILSILTIPMYHLPEVPKTPLKLPFLVELAQMIN